ncbi:sodium:alanine symporter family protein [Oribacterium sp. C9]|uniref:alanine/glycine:cation symporter family protein n=1 Tax=Oribacterium sp. C9 TaxID=1943579 RepID=UPI00099014E6|nr:alanine/glycine:cation symporter family protein [Oribacterium sp. C9]OON85718.1 sodium:alanine symporter family protein [Oribacterium sp. C9]
MLQKIETINGIVNSFVWGLPMLVLLVGTGILMTLLTKCFQLTHFMYWIKNTLGGIFSNKTITEHTDKSDRQISQFQSLCTALAATIGTGNIAGVAAALATGGPGSIFWMWITAFFGMMTNYSENVLGIFYRRKNSYGEWSGGAMYYLSDGLGSKKGCKYIGKTLAIMFATFCVIASFGIGNMSQINSIAVNMNSVFGIPMIATGIGLMIIAGLVIVGGIKRIAAVTEKLVPFMAIAYTLGSILIVIFNYTQVAPSFVAIFKGAFALKSVGGGIVGSGVRSAVTWGMKRGVFSNEAGLGSSVMVHSASNVKEPAQQGMWGIFEVFADTIVVCTLTALAVLTSGVMDLNTGAMVSQAEKTALVSESFSVVFGPAGGAFIALAILLFAFSTTLGWSIYGTKAFEYLFGTKATIGYKILFVLFIAIGATMNLELAWDLSDTFNGLMAIPNLIGVISLSGTVSKITKNYIDRKINRKNITPMYSAFPIIQKEQEESVESEKTKSATIRDAV